ncbi:MAG: NERD domain-containing protein [Bacilli bacterium]
MAKMIPDMPKKYDSRSQEGLMYEELNKLSDEYYVFHSFSIVNVKERVINESEIDFVIFHPMKGILCIEAKAGEVDYNDGYWKYNNGIKMSHDGPYNQAKSNKWKLKDSMLNHGLQYEVEHCKFLHAVWFPNITLVELTKKQLPSEADINITLTSDSFNNIEKSINQIFQIEVEARINTCLSEKEVNVILERVLAPSFKLISFKEIESERTNNVFRRMLKEQVALLDYLEEQNNAIINGLAGSGKTVMAIEKARRHSEKGEAVLFLCYNVFLKDYLKEKYNYSHVSYYTIDGLACKICETHKSNYILLLEKLNEMSYNGSFPYQHVIIDEGQDFGKVELEDEIIISLKSNVINDAKENGTFYLFYDKNQMIQSQKVLNYIENADCKLTLYRNCRNTENIALTSLRLLGSSQSPKLFQEAILGDLAEFSFCSTSDAFVSTLNCKIDKYINDGYTNLTILTCKTEEKSIISNYCSDSKYNYEHGYVKFTTCRKFKGLESDAVIVIDIDEDTFNTQGEQLMYVGTSRARIKLSCIISMNENDCLKLMEKKGINHNKNILKSFSTAFNAKLN